MCITAMQGALTTERSGPVSSTRVNRAYARDTTASQMPNSTDLARLRAHTSSAVCIRMQPEVLNAQLLAGPFRQLQFPASQGSHLGRQVEHIQADVAVV